MPCSIVLTGVIAISTLIPLSIALHEAGAATLSSRSPHPVQIGYPTWAIACPSVTTCVVVGAHGGILTTEDGGRHWTRRASGTTGNLVSVTCPSRAVCYATGSSMPGPPSQNPHNVILRSVDGGRTWRQPSSNPPFGPSLIPATVTCPDVRTCLVSGIANDPSTAMLRTRDGGKTWRRIDIPVGEELGAATCPTITTCYGINGLSGQVGRSADGGTTWHARARVPRGGLQPSLSPEVLEAIVCGKANTCLVTSSYCCHEGSRGDVFLSRDGANTWTRLHHWDGRSVYEIACPDAALCYVSTQGAMLRTSDGGRTWSLHRVPADAASLTIACPRPETCYTTAGRVVLKTIDGFAHTQKMTVP